MTVTILFTYHRYNHTKMVLEALAKGVLLPEKLIIFQDGIKKTTDLDNWEKVNRLIKSVDFCDSEVVVSDVNKGLATSVIEGMNYAFERFEKVIVLEDDCVPAKTFIEYMEKALDVYERCDAVYSVGGYAWPIDVEAKNGEIAYFVGRFSSWGWGTWKNRWEKYIKDTEIVSRLMKNKASSRNLLRWGNDLEMMLRDSMAGKNDSWAVYWALTIIENEGRCLSPYKSLIKNIGMDGTGTNCDRTNSYDVVLEDGTNRNYVFPETTEYIEEIEIAFEKFENSSYARTQGDESKKHILVYGAGYYFKLCENYLYDNYYIEAIIDQNKTGYYGEVPIISIDKIIDYEQLPVVIMLMDEKLCGEIADMLKIRCNLPSDQIIRGKDVILQ